MYYTASYNGWTYQHEGLDVISCEPHLGTFVLVHVKEHVKQVLLVPLAGAVRRRLPPAPPLGIPRRQYPLHHGVELAVHRVDALAQALHVPMFEHADVVLQVERARQLGGLGDQAPHLLGGAVVPGPPPAHHHPRDDVARDAHEHGVHVDGRAVARAPGQGAHEAGHLLAADVAEPLQRAPGKELVHARALHEAPVGPVRREGEVLPAVRQAVHRRGLGAVQERGLVGLEHLAGGVRGAGGDGRHGAEAEVQERAVAGCQAVQRLVRERGQEVQVAQDGQSERARREPKPATAAAAQHKENGEAGNEEENGEACGVDEFSCCDHFHGDSLSACRSELTSELKPLFLLSDHASPWLFI
jgi:hypothetical protein